MIGRITAVAGMEFRIAMRNRWLAVAAAAMVALALVLALAGAAPGGARAVDPLAIAVANLTSLGVYLVPLLALLLAFDAIAGDIDRGTLALVATYPVRRAEILAGKFAAHITVLALAVGTGFGAATALALIGDWSAVASLDAVLRLWATALLLGAAFLGIGYAASALARGAAGAAGYAIAIWLGGVVLYDAALLGAVVADDNGAFTRHALPWLLALNPADAFRLLNLSTGPTAAVTGLLAADKAVPPFAALGALLLWPALALVLAERLLARREL